MFRTRYDVGALHLPGWHAAENNPDEYYFDATAREYRKRHAIGTRVSYSGHYGRVLGKITHRDADGYDCITWDGGALSVQPPGDPKIVAVR